MMLSTSQLECYFVAKSCLCQKLSESGGSHLGSEIESQMEDVCKVTEAQIGAALETGSEQFDRLLLILNKSKKKGGNK